MENDNHLVLLAGLCKNAGLTPEEASKLINNDSMDFYNEMMRIYYLTHVKNANIK